MVGSPEINDELRGWLGMKWETDGKSNERYKQERWKKDIKYENAEGAKKMKKKRLDRVRYVSNTLGDPQAINQPSLYI